MGANSNYRFEQFELDPRDEVLLAGGQPIALNPRTFKLLHLLVRNHGQLVTKNQIMEQVWEGLFVEENNLAVQMSALRKVLGDGPHGQPFVVNVPGQGYRFVATVMMAAEEPAPVPAQGGFLGGRGRWIAAGTLSLTVLGAAALGWLQRGQHAAGTPPRLSIAVLPFRNLSSDPEQTYLADAVSDDLTTDLARLPGSFVIARESADTYRDKTVTAQQVGRELGVRYMLEGSVRPAADRLLINAQLIDTGSGAHLWAERFDTARAELGAAQAEIVNRISNALSISLVEIESRRAAADRPQNPDALDLFFRARSILDRDRSAKGLGAAQPLLEKAVRTLQPHFLDALNDLSWLLLRRVTELNYSGHDDWQKAEGLIERARAIDPRDPRAAANKGQLLLLDGNCPEAIPHFQSAIKLDGGNLLARDGLGLCGDILGHPDEMVRAMREVLALNPEDPGNSERYGHLGLALLMQDHPEDAIEWLRKAEAGLSRPAERFERGLIEAYALTGRLPQAREKFADYDRQWPHRSVWRESCYSSKASSSLPGLNHAYSGLRAAGMREFAAEDADDGVQPPAVLQPLDFYASTPLSAPGAKTIVTATLASLLKQMPKPVIFDVGCGQGVISGADFVPWVEDGNRLDDDIQARFAQAIATRTGGDLSRPVIVMGSGVYGWGPYNAVLRAVALGYRNVYWYRGGEEAAAAAHMETDDRRNP